MTCTITAVADLDVSLMSEQEYIAYQRCLDDQLTDRYYSRGLTPPGMTPMPTTLTDLQPPF